MLTRKVKNGGIRFDLEVGGMAEGPALDSAVAKAAAAMTRLRRSRQLRGDASKARDRHVFRVHDRQHPDASRAFKPQPFRKGPARARGTDHSRCVYADRPGHGEGLWLMRGTLVIPKAAARRSHWYGGLGR